MGIIKSNLIRLVFAGRWLQAPLYIGLILVLGLYVYRFLLGLYDIAHNVNNLNDIGIMLGVLDLIDVVMIANLLIMVIIGGYQTFVSPLNLKSETDRLEWLDSINAGSMKVKLALSLIGISSIHLLRTFIDPSSQSNFAVLWQVVIHLTLVLSALAIAFTNRILEPHTKGLA